MNKYRTNHLPIRLLIAFSLLFSTSFTAIAQKVIFPQPKQAGIAKVQEQKKSYTLKNNLLTAKFAVQNGKLLFYGCPQLGLNSGTELFRIQLGNGNTISSSDMNLVSVSATTLKPDNNASTASLLLPGKAIRASFTYGNLSIEWRAVLRNGSHYLRTEMDITASADQDMKSIVPMIYAVDSIKVGTPKVVGNTRGAILASNKIFAGLETPMGINTVFKDSINADRQLYIQGLWSRNTSLSAGSTWNISSVVGLIAPNQARRSFLAYSERERAVPWRAYPVYISWYELNIDRNNAPAPDYKGNMTIAQCTDVITHWKDKFFDKYQIAPKAFVWDDGWDEYGTWTFSPNFPNGFTEAGNEAKKMNAGIGAWLGPVGGYGLSGEFRRAYWKEKGGMQLSNKDYYKFFVNACTDMVKNYDFRFFKFDGISAQFSSVGPDPGARGDENAEAIINIERDVRKAKSDIFINTTVGTWASPFWFHFTDAVWRQEQDFGTIGDQGSDRERWITYRDRLVYQNFVTNSPLCPINTLMTHGFILSSFGDVAKDMNYDGIVREMRCAFACGSGMVELYNDYALMDAIKDNNGNAGALWKDLAECMHWQRQMADVLPDSHWVGGNPWDGTKANVYGWAAWNGKKATLTLRNPATTPQQYTTTLRRALEIPTYIRASITLSDAFAQSPLQGLTTGKPINIDTPITVTLPASSVFIFNGIQK